MQFKVLPLGPSDHVNVRDVPIPCSSSRYLNLSIGATRREGLNLQESGRRGGLTTEQLTSWMHFCSSAIPSSRVKSGDQRRTRSETQSISTSIPIYILNMQLVHANHSTTPFLAKHKATLIIAQGANNSTKLRLA